MNARQGTADRRGQKRQASPPPPKDEKPNEDPLHQYTQKLGANNLNVNYVDVTVNIASFDEVASEFYDCIVNFAFPHGPQTVIISRERFIIFYRWALKMRLDFLLSNVRNTRRRDEVLFSRIDMVAPLATLINNFASVSVRQGTRIVFPFQPPEVDRANQIKHVCTPEICEAHQRFLALLSNQIGMRTESMSDKLEGTAYWCLKVVDQDGVVPTRHKFLTLLPPVLHVAASFSEWTPRDALLACLLFRGTTEDPIDDRSVFFKSSAIERIHSVRVGFFLGYASNPPAIFPFAPFSTVSF